MLGKRKGRRWVAALAVLAAAAIVLARQIGEPAPPPPGELPTYEAEEAVKHVGEHARVCGTVVDAAYVPETRGRPTFLNFGKPYPDPLFTALVWGEDRGRFRRPPERAYLGRRICVRGRIERHEGRPEIVVRQPGQLVPERNPSPGGVSPGSRAPRPPP